MAAVVRLLTILAWVLLCAPASAHDLRPGAVALRELEPGRFALRLTQPQDGAGGTVRLTPTLPDHCRFAPDGIRCEGPLEGPLRIDDLKPRRVKVVVHITWLDGRTFQTLLTEGQHSLDIPKAGATATAPEVESYLQLGIEHILGGIDHLLFVLALALVAASPRRVAVAVTGFTVGHSVTLSAAALSWVSAPAAATELVIAASIALLAAEAARRKDTLTSRYPWAIAALFGLVHGFGFAGALAEIGLPQQSRAWALLAFNVGVELGQLAVLGVGLLLAAAFRGFARQPQLQRARQLAPYALGIPAGIWTVERAVAWGAALT